jgi:hypothetical protein
LTPNAPDSARRWRFSEPEPIRSTFSPVGFEALLAAHGFRVVSDTARSARSGAGRIHVGVAEREAAGMTIA